MHIDELKSNPPIAFTWRETNFFRVLALPFRSTVKWRAS